MLSYLGTCIGIDDRGENYGFDATEFAQAIEDSIEISPEEFWKHAKGPKELQDKDLEYAFNPCAGISWGYDPEEDIHYIFQGFPLKEDLTLRQLKGSQVSTTTSKYADERYEIMGDGYSITKLITSEYHQQKDYILAKFLTEATDKYPDGHEFKDVDPATHTLQYDPSQTYELWIMFYPVKQTAAINGLEFDVNGIKKALEGCYVKVWSNSPSFHYQGFNYNLSRKKASLFPTTIRPQKWDKIHGSALLDKHLYQTLQDVSQYFDEIASKALNNLKESKVREAVNPDKENVVFSIGRMNPYTKGHDKLVDKLIATAQSIQADAVLFITQTQDAIKNPLTWEEKVTFIKKACSHKPIIICDDKNVKSPFDAAVWLSNKNYKNIVAIFGEDRVTEMEAMYNKYNGKDTPKGKYEFDTIQVVSAGDRDPDAEGVEGFSATKARNAAVDGDFGTFYKIVGTPDEGLARQLFLAVRKGMNIEEALARLTIYARIHEISRIPLTELYRNTQDMTLAEVIKFGQTFTKKVALEEGGSATQSDRILRSDIEPTLDVFVPILMKLIPDAQFRPIGSTGKKPENGDIDLGLETSLSLSEVAAKFKAEGYEAVENKGLGEVSIKFNQYSPNGKENGKSVQIDLMVGNLSWLTFMYMGYGPDETGFKPLTRTACLYAMLRYSPEEIMEDGSVYFYSLSPNKGAFQKVGKEVNGKFSSTRVSEENISDPQEIANLVSAKSSMPWTVEELTKPIEYILNRAQERFDPETFKKIKTYIVDFLDKQKLEGPSSLREAKTSHLTHIEDLIVDEGYEGGKKTLEYLESLFDDLGGSVPKNKMKTTLKWDGSPAIVMSERYPGIAGPFVGMKNTFSPKAPQIFQTPEEIDARYGDKPDLANKLKVALHYLPMLGIPEGEVWKGDFLFTREDLETYEDDGKTWITFQPNTLVYAVDSESELGKKIEGCELGIVFHTRYKGDDLRTAESTATFDIDISQLNEVPEVFIIDANLPALSSGKEKLSEPVIYTVSRLLQALKTSLDLSADLANEIASNSTLNAIMNQYENYAVRAGFQFEDLKKYLETLYTFIDAYYEKDAQTKKTEKGKAASYEKASSIKQFFGDREEEFYKLVEFQRDVVHLKSILSFKLNSLASVSSFTRGDSGLVPAGHEGFAVSDVEGNIIKIVDRLGFSRMNLTRHTEAVDSSTLTDDDLLEAISLLGLNLRKKVSSRTWIVEDPDNRREEKIRAFLKDVGGALVGTRDVKIGKYTLVFKNTKFVGQGGIKFEKDIVESLASAGSPLDEYLPKIGLTLDDVKKVEHLGGLNTSRAINFSLLESQSVLVALPAGASEGDFDSIGDALSDARVYLKEMNPESGKNYINISIKSGKKVTFINSGIVNRGAWTWNKAIFHIGKALGFSSDDCKTMIDGFEEAAEIRDQRLNSKRVALQNNQEEEVSSLVERRSTLDLNGSNYSLNMINVKRFIDNAIGEDYLMIHDNHSLYISSEIREMMSKNLVLDKVAMPGKDRARLDVYLHSDGLSQIIINIRPKHEASIYPTYIMCDYVIRPELWSL